jgi:predicted glutamine amidotransferase
MCELLGMSSNHTTTINISLTTLSERGESPRLHGDGWGVAFYEGADVRLIKDTGEAKDSEWVRFITGQHIHSHDIIAHIRKSTMGKVSYSNTHPFVRELHGRMHSFAHNGTLKGIFETPGFSPALFQPVGDTDSEQAFCVLMDRMRKIWNATDHIPALSERLELIAQFAHELRELGPANFLYSDGEAIFAHGHHRHDPITDRLEWPGLHYLERNCEQDHQFDKSWESGIAFENEENDRIVLFASVPLTDNENWHPLNSGEIIAVTRGQIRYSTLRS